MGEESLTRLDAQAAKEIAKLAQERLAAKFVILNRNIVASAYNPTEDEISVHPRHHVLPTLPYLTLGSMSF